MILKTKENEYVSIQNPTQEILSQIPLETIFRNIKINILITFYNDNCINIPGL